MSRTSPNTPKETKSTAIQRLLTRKSGATVASLQKATGWQAHSVRAALSKFRKAGFVIDKVPPKSEGRGPAYRIVVTPEAT